MGSSPLCAQTPDLAESALVAALHKHGSEIFGYLVGTMRSDVDAAEVYAQFCHDAWTARTAFRGDCSTRTWLYMLANHAKVHYLRDPYLRRRASFPDAISDLIGHCRTQTQSYLRSDNKNRLQQIRSRLSAEDQSILVLRVDRNLSWRQVAYILDGQPDPDARRISGLRKRFERIKQQLRQWMEETSS